MGIEQVINLVGEGVTVPSHSAVSVTARMIQTLRLTTPAKFESLQDLSID